VLASGVMPAGFPFTAGFRVVFEEAVYELTTEFADGPPKVDFQFVPPGGERRPVGVQGHNPYEKELRHFVECVRDPTKASFLKPEHAIAALELSLATQRALRERATVQLA